MSELNLTIPYEPRPVQEYFHAHRKRFNVCVWHRRTGKTTAACAELAHSGWEVEYKNPQLAYIAPTYRQAKQVAWQMLIEMCKELPGYVANKSELSIQFDRPDKGDFIKIFLMGADNPDAHRGIYLDGAVLDEYAQMNPIMWGEIIRPALSDRLGWAIFIGTPKGQNHFFRTYREYTELMDNGDPDYATFLFKASETGIILESELIDMKKTMEEHEYRQEMECDFTAAVQGAYFAKYINDLEDKGHIIDFEYEPTSSVTTYWDLGISDSTAIWFVQLVGREIRVIDYFENSGVGLEVYAKYILSKPYVYAPYGHFLPHDAVARELGTGRSRQEVLRDFGIHSTIVPRLSLADGINAARTMLQKNIWFNSKAVTRGLDALKNYQRKFDSKNGIFQDKPLHDWSSHAADAFRYFAISGETPDKPNPTQFELQQWSREDAYDPLDY